MSEPTPESTEPTPSQGNPVDDPDAAALGDAGKKALDAMKADRNKAQREAAALKAELDAINAANLSDLEKAQNAATEAQAEALRSSMEALRLRVAAKHGISDEDADLFLTGPDLETVEKQASALVARTVTTETRPGPRADLSQGSKGESGSSDPAQQFASIIRGQLG